MTDRPAVAVFRPDDERLATAIELLEDAGVEPVPDPMLAIEPTGAGPPTDADVVVFTSKTGAEIAAEAGWDPADATIVAIGPATADALATAGVDVDLVPEEYSSRGLVEALAADVEGRTVGIARSDHGSDVLIEGLEAAGAVVEETVLYRLRRPDSAGESTELAAAGDLDGALFTSSLTVEHFLEAAADRGVEAPARRALAAAVVVGAIGEPTAETLREADVDPDVVPERAEVTALVDAAVDVLDGGDP